MPVRFPLRTVVLVCFLLVGRALPTAAAERPNSELLALVPNDVGFCFVLQDARERFERVRQSPFAAAFLKSALGKELLEAPEWQKLAEVDAFLTQNLQTNLRQLREDLLGDALVLAYRPGPPDQPDLEQDLILVRARDAALLARLLAKVNEAQKGTGELKDLQPIQHRGQSYHRRVLHKETSFYWLHGNTIAISSREAMIRAVIDAAEEGAERKPASLARRFETLGLERSAAALWINPRAFEPALVRKASRAAGAEAAALTMFQTYLAAIDGVGLGLDLAEDARATLAVQGRLDALPEPARRFFSVGSRASELWNRFPKDALFSFAVRFDAAAFAEMVGGFLTDEQRKKLREGVDRGLGAVLGKDFFREFLPDIGPDWGISVMAPERAGEWFPRILAGCLVKGSAAGRGTDQFLLNGLNSVAMLAVLAHNREKTKPLAIRSQLQDDVEVKFLTGAGALPPGLRPAFALKEGMLLLATSPNVIESTRSAGPPASATTGAIPIIQVSFVAWIAYLKENREALLAIKTGPSGMTKVEAERQFDGLVRVLELFDRMELTQTILPNQVRITLALRPMHPLQTPKKATD